MELNSRNAVMLVLMAVTAFAVVAVLLVSFVPGPLRQNDYMVIGAVSTLAALCVVFGAVVRTAGIRDVFFRRRK
jgi:uncharacterized membrane protein YozB (DUF420 family)